MRIFFLLLVILTIVSCKPKPKPIIYSDELPKSKILNDSIDTKLDNPVFVSRKIPGNSINSALDSNGFVTRKIIKNNSAFSCMEELPYYIGGDSARIRFLQENIEYPQTAIDDSIQGTVYVWFLINKNGSISKAKIIRGLQYDIDNACIKATEKMPKWVPAKIMGKIVEIHFGMPIRFFLKYDSISMRAGIYSKNKNIIEKRNIIETKIYPNPSTNFITIEISRMMNDLVYQLLDSNGQMLKSGQIFSDKESVDITSLDKGIYFIRLISKELNWERSEKLIKK